MINRLHRHCNATEHLVVEMVTIGQEKWGEKSYRIAVCGATSENAKVPHIHIYDATDTNLVHPQSDFVISLVDILTKGQINLISQVDRSKQIALIETSDCSWQGYRDVLNGFKSFLCSKPTSTKRGGTFIDNLDRAIHEWNRETDLNGYEKSGKNPLKEYIEGLNLTILPKFQKYFEE